MNSINRDRVGKLFVCFGLLVVLILKPDTSWARAGLNEWELPTPVQGYNIGCNDAMPQEQQCVAIYTDQGPVIGDIKGYFFSIHSVFGQTRDGKWFSLAPDGSIIQFASYEALSNATNEDPLLWIRFRSAIANAGFIVLGFFIAGTWYLVFSRPLSSGGVFWLGVLPLVMISVGLFGSLDELVIKLVLYSFPFLASIILLLWPLRIVIGWVKTCLASIVPERKTFAIEMFLDVVPPSLALFFVGRILISSPFLFPVGQFTG